MHITEHDHGGLTDFAAFDVQVAADDNDRFIDFAANLGRGADYHHGLRPLTRFQLDIMANRHQGLPGSVMPDPEAEASRPRGFRNIGICV